MSGTPNDPQPHRGRRARFLTLGVVGLPLLAVCWINPAVAAAISAAATALALGYSVLKD